MRPGLIFLIIVFASFIATAQNLVSNPSFEQYTTCPTNFAQITKCINWQNHTSGGSPDYFNACAATVSGVKVPNNFLGSQAAASGNAYAGIISYNGASPDFREYVNGTLSSLSPGAVYEVSVSVSLADSSGYGIDDLGAYFYANGAVPIVTSQALPVAPHVSYTNYGALTNKLGWVRLAGTFKADSAYSHIVIGSFKNDALQTRVATPPGSNSYYYVDSVVVRILSKVFFVLTDTNFCAGDSIVMPYTVGQSGYFNSANIFTLQMSDAAGSFSNPLNLVSLATNSSGVLRGVLPKTTSPGIHYRIRIVSSSPADTSLDNGFDFVISTPPGVSTSADTSLCAGGTVHISATSTGTGINYSWAGAAGFSSNAQSFSISNINISQSGKYIVTASDGVCSAKDTVNVNVIAIPAKPEITVNSPCEGDTIRFSFKADTGTVQYFWDWANWAPILLTDTGVVDIADTTMEGSYVVIADRSGCTNTDTAEVVIKRKPKVAATNNGPLRVGDELRLYVTGDSTALTYYWTGPNGFSSVLKDPVIDTVQLEAAGSYGVLVKRDGCISSGITTVSILDRDDEILVLFPNPNDGTFTIKGSVKKDQQIAMKIFNDIGQVIYRDETVANRRYVNKTVTMPYVANGVYFLRIRVDGENKSFKFVVKH